MAPRFEGGTFANFGPAKDVCQQMAKYAIFHQYFVSSIHKKEERLPAFRATQCWPYLESMFTHCFLNVVPHEFWLPRTSLDSF